MIKSLWTFKETLEFYRDVRVFQKNYGYFLREVILEIIDILEKLPTLKAALEVLKRVKFQSG